MSNDVSSMTPAQQALVAGGLATGALAALAPGAFHRLYGTGAVDGKTLSMTRYFGNSLASASVLVALAGEEQRSQVFTAAAVFNTTSGLLAFVADGVPTGTRVRAALTSFAFAALSAKAAQG